MDSVGLVLLVMVFISALAYMAAQLVRRPEYEAWAKTQLYQVAFSAFLAGSVVFFASFACGIASDLVGGGDPFDVAFNYISGFLSIVVSDIYVFKTSVQAQFMASIFINLPGAPSFGIGFPAFPMYTLIASNMQFLFFLMPAMLASLLAQLAGLQIIKQTAFTILLPVGVLFRSFSFTRDAGSFIMALAVGLFIIYPLTYVMDKVIVEGPSVTDPVTGSVVTGYADDWTPFFGAENVCGAFASNPPPGVFSGKEVREALRVIGGFSPCVILPVMHRTGHIFAQGIFLPTLNLIIVVAFVNSMTKFLTRNFS